MGSFDQKAKWAQTLVQECSTYHISKKNKKFQKLKLIRFLFPMPIQWANNTELFSIQQLLNC